ncbi:hypothetical protein QJS64_19175 (plasmid) [Paraclostridium bifermentans]|uniref:Uncharacterized protein n=1 Tax=Paraclostridium bifermentans TaxID=1490 RepID=A0ABY8R934_PARBF|nr:hypothetical protein QJS64_19175 [Paraclostridium bifermentans]
MKTIYRTYEDTEIVQLATNIKCPYCEREWQEYDMDSCGATYILTCGNEYDEGCGKKFEMHFDVD